MFYMPSPIFRIIVCLLVLFPLQESLSQNIPRDFIKITDSLLREKPITYFELNGALRPYRRDTILMPYFIEAADKAGYNVGVSFGANQLGTKYRNISQYDRAITYHQRALEAALDADNIEFRIFSLNMLGVVYRRLDAIKTALDYNQEALKLAESIENPSEGIKRSRNVSLNGIGNIYEALKQYDLAINHYEQSLQLEGELNNKRGLAVNHQNIGECLEAKGQLDQALYHYNKSLEYDLEINSEYGLAICRNSIAQVYIKQDRADEALEILGPNIDLARKVGDQHIIAPALINTGWAHMKEGEYTLAKDYISQGLYIALEHNLLRTVSGAYLLLSDLEKDRGNMAEALENYKLHEQYDNQVNNELNLNYVNDVIIRYDTEKKINQIQVLAAENEIVKLKLRRNQNTLLMSAMLLILFALVLYIIYRQYQIKSERKLLTLEQSMLRSQMNPHFLFNSLNSIKLYIINNEQKNAVHYLNKFSKLVRKILEASSLKEISLAEELETVELYMNIENIRFSNEIDFTVNIEEGIDPHLIKIPSLILQPFLENALWHGLSSKQGEKKVSLEVSREGSDFIQIAIIDNGVGREAAEDLRQRKILKRKSVGIEITKERLANFSKDYQNSFEIEIIDLFDENQNPSGTKVILHIPTI